jgi:hypothetical protein
LATSQATAATAEEAAEVAEVAEPASTLKSAAAQRVSGEASGPPVRAG